MGGGSRLRTTGKQHLLQKEAQREAEPRAGCPQAAGCLSRALELCVGLGLPTAQPSPETPRWKETGAVGRDVGAHGPRSEHRGVYPEETLT